MRAAHEGLPPRSFDRPPGIVEVTICAEGGMLPSPVCPATRLERFTADTVPQRPDDTHVMVRIDPVRECRAPDEYPQARTMLRIYRLLPPEAGPWAANAGVPLPPRAMCSPLPEVAEEQRNSQTPASSTTGNVVAPPFWRSVPLLITSPGAWRSLCLESRRAGRTSTHCYYRRGNHGYRTGDGLCQRGAGCSVATRILAIAARHASRMGRRARCWRTDRAQPGGGVRGPQRTVNGALPVVRWCSGAPLARLWDAGALVERWRASENVAC